MEQTQIKKMDDTVSKIAKHFGQFGYTIDKEGFAKYYIGIGNTRFPKCIQIWINENTLMVQINAFNKPVVVNGIKEAVQFIKNNTMNFRGFGGGSYCFGRLQQNVNKELEKQKAKEIWLRDICD